MRPNGLQEILRSPVVKEKDPLSKAPEWRGPELVRRGLALTDVVGEAGPHLVDRQIGEKRHGLIA